MKQKMTNFPGFVAYGPESRRNVPDLPRHRRIVVENSSTDQFDLVVAHADTAGYGDVREYTVAEE